ncbi:Pyrimidine reductase, riboflavin biosynthesis [Lentzea xinjiangensis]|uniref:Pyrimidine reductase, riboflavin biosynthesis n=1 Tax=Lentzea xinjiangensis TaxID=402600 RepID=A0A1H9N811_9PSEU|nr:dihydrofolate reductase family protein [Lentzea xinjiangensis]SER31799.1 Pyrimidine reductase, riboflavin biosynthesis [Lentzea xinjiangensis]
MTDTALESLYAYPEDRTWVTANFVSSVDGAVSVDGRSAGLGSEADKRIYTLGRELADVVVVGAATVLIEGYRGARRERPLPIAVVTARGSLTPDLPLFTDTEVPPIVITCAAAPLPPLPAEVVIAGDTEVDLGIAVAELAARGLRRINLEGGPRLFGAMVAEGLVDGLNLTVSPMLAVGDSSRIAHGPVVPPVDLALASVLRAEDVLLLRYLRRNSS